MNTRPDHSIVMISCSVFRAEVTVLWKRCWPDLQVPFQSSMLHMNPAKLGNRLQSMVEEALGKGHRVVLVYGECYPGMDILESRPGVARTRGGNCAEMVLGRKEYRRLLREGAFFLLPDWAARGEKYFKQEMGLSRENATSLMQESHRKLLYLDTGVVPIPEQGLQAVSNYCGLPWEIQSVSLDGLQAIIEEALHRLNAAEPLG